MMDKGQQEVLSYMDFREWHLVKILGVNMLHRLNGSVTLNADVVGVSSSSRRTAGFLGDQLLEQDNEFAVQKLYMSVEAKVAVSENPAARLLPPQTVD